MQYFVCVGYGVFQSNKFLRVCSLCPITRRFLDTDCLAMSAISSTFCRRHAYVLIAQIPRTRPGRVTKCGRQVIMGASICLRELHFPSDHLKIAA